MISPARHRTVLALLLLRADQMVTVEDLIAGVWGESPPRDARATIQTYVHRLRRALGGNVIETRPGGYSITAGPDNLDLARFDALLRAADQTTDAAHEATLLTEALALWRGPALSNVPSEALHRNDVPALDERRLRAVQRKLDLDLAAGRHTEAVGELRALTSSHPLREGFWARLMIALAGSGRRAEALAVYQEVRGRLVQDLGVDPGPELQETHRAVLRNEITASGAMTRLVPSQLPPDVPGFVGRIDELHQLDAALAAGVVGVLVGCAGVGKTTLAVHWAHRVANRFPDGQLYVDLRGFDPDRPPADPEEAIRGFLDALIGPSQAVPGTFDRQVALYRSLIAGRRILVLLDNARDAEQVRPLLPGSRRAMTVVTSRQRLSALVASENARPIHLDPLTDIEARDLLVGRLGAARVAAEPHATNDIVSHCGGLPLALAVAAARVATHPKASLTALAAELTLTGDGLGELHAHDAATDVQAVFSCSYRALRQPAAQLFSLLGVHPGPYTAAAAASLAGIHIGHSRRLLNELCEANLLAEESPGRYVFHDLLRRYAARLCETRHGAPLRRSALRRLLDHFLHTAHTAVRLIEPHHHRGELTPIPAAAGVTPTELIDQAAALAWLTTEYPVLTAAVHQAAQHDFDTHCWQLAWSLEEFCFRQGYWTDQTTTGHLALGAARRQKDRTGQGHAHRAIARAYFRLGRLDAAEDHYRRALELFHSRNDLIAQAFVHGSLGWLLAERGRYRQALHHDQRALALYRAAGHRAGQARALNGVAWYQALLGQPKEALTTSEQALHLLDIVQDVYGQAATWHTIGYAHHHLGDHRAAITGYRHSLRLYRQIGDRYTETRVLSDLAATYEAAGDSHSAAQCRRLAVAILHQIGQVGTAPGGH